MGAHTYLSNVLLFLLILFRSADNKQCLGNDQCSCTFDTDSSVVDVSSLGNTDSTPRFKDVESQDGNKYSYNPCYPFNEGQCQQASACAIANGQEIEIGSTENVPVIWSVKDDTGEVVMIYAGGPAAPTSVTQVILVCDPHACTPQLTADGTQGLGTYQLTLATVCACPNGCDSKGPKNCNQDSVIGGGTIFIIVFFSLALVYLLGGMLFMKFVKKAQGTNVIPNKSFWVGLPSTVKAGFLCVLSPVLRRRKYDGI